MKPLDRLTLCLADACKVVVGLLFIISGAKAQYSGLGSWNIVNLNYQHTAKWSFFAESQLRSLGFYNQFHYYEAKAAIQYKVQPGFAITLGAGTYQTYKEGGNFVTPKNNDEFRIWPQFLLYQSVGKFKIEQRYRAELRFTSNGYRNRFRYRMSLSYPFGKSLAWGKPYSLSVSNELFFTDKEPYFERNRAACNFMYKPKENVHFMLGYLHQFDYKINDETGRDFLQVGIYFLLKNPALTSAKKQ